jgi:hypothetical protein
VTFPVGVPYVELTVAVNVKFSLVRTGLGVAATVVLVGNAAYTCSFTDPELVA